MIPPAGLLQLLGSVVLLSSAWPITKVALAAGAVPMWFAVGRAVCSALAAFAALGLLRRLRLPGRRDLPALLGVGLGQLAAFFAFAHEAVAYVPAGRTTILCNVTTIFIAPLSLLVLREAIPARRWAAAGLGVLGAVVLMGPWAIDWNAPGILPGHVYLLGAAFTFSLAIVVVRAWPPSLSMLQLLPWCFVVATLALLPLALRHGGIGAWPAASLWSMAYIGGFAGPVGTWCVMEVAANLPAMVASVGLLATPAAGLALSTWWLGEAFGPDLMLGSALILAGVGIAAWPPRKRARRA
jgi:drug/metabolite transporter (DMT)-like permease